MEKFKKIINLLLPFFFTACLFGAMIAGICLHTAARREGLWKDAPMSWELSTGLYIATILLAYGVGALTHLMIKGIENEQGQEQG